MKNLIILILTVFTFLDINAQGGYPCDIASAGISPSAVQLHPGETLSITFSIWNAGGDPTCAYAPNQITAVLSLPPYLAFNSFVYPAGGNGPYFTWTYDATDHVVIGVNHSPIGWQQGEADVTFNFDVLTPPSYPSYNPVSLDIDPAGISNYPDNDDYMQPLWINAPLPIKLISFYGTSVDCDHIDLHWETASEVNNAYMEVLRSSDGKEFLSIGKVEGANLTIGSKYSLEDHNYLVSNVKYYYIIRQVDFDGKMTHHDMIVVKHACDEEIKSMVVFPNPAIYKVNLTFTGFAESTDLNLNLTNSDGKLVKVINASTNQINEISIEDLQPGIYQFQNTASGQELSAKFIKIK